MEEDGLYWWNKMERNTYSLLLDNLMLISNTEHLPLNGYLNASSSSIHGKSQLVRLQRAKPSCLSTLYCPVVTECTTRFNIKKFRVK
jgi:hypothetical protein